MLRELCELGKETGGCERTQVDDRNRKAGVLALWLRQRGRLSVPREEAVVFFLFVTLLVRQP